MQTVVLKQFSVVWNARREAANSTKRFNQCLKKTNNYCLQQTAA